MHRTQMTLDTETISRTDVLYMAIELSRSKWKVGLSSGRRNDRMSTRTVDAGDFDALLEAIGRARRRYELADDCAVMSVQEAGRDGFWIHRVLEENGVRSFVVDPASIEVNRRGRRRKTDAIDVEQLLRRIIAWHAGDRDVFAICNVPSRADQDDRRLGRELGRLKHERTALINVLRSQFALHSAEKIRLTDAFIDDLDDWKAGDGRPLGGFAKAEIRRAYRRLQLVEQQITEVEARDQGLAKAGNRRCRTLLVELAWRWSHHQADSELGKWFWDKWGWGSKRLRKIGASALARKLAVRLYYLAEHGELPNGARLKTV